MSTKIQSSGSHTQPKQVPHTQNDKYKDPLNNWMIKSLSYSNEIGTGINEIAPKLTFALWIPTFMYLGADIYDKYKNDKNEYNPSGKRVVKRAIAQGLSSFILPAGAILLGQKITSPIGKFISDKLSINAKDSIYKHTKDVIDQAFGTNFDNKEDFKTIIHNSLENKVRALENSKHTNNIFKKFYRYLTGYYALVDAKKEQLFTFANKNTDILFEIKENLQRGTNKSKIPKRIQKKYDSIKPVMQKIYGEDSINYALKCALKEYQNMLIVKNKVLKTLGGLISLILLINPINYLVDKIIMPRYIVPGMDKISDKLKESNHLRLHVKKFEDYNNQTRKHTPIEKNELKTSKISPKAEQNTSKTIDNTNSKTKANQKVLANPQHNHLQQTSPTHLEQEKKS